MRNIYLKLVLTTMVSGLTQTAFASGCYGAKYDLLSRSPLRSFELQPEELLDLRIEPAGVNVWHYYTISFGFKNPHYYASDEAKLVKFYYYGGVYVKDDAVFARVLARLREKFAKPIHMQETNVKIAYTNDCEYDDAFELESGIYSAQILDDARRIQIFDMPSLEDLSPDPASRLPLFPVIPIEKDCDVCG